MSLAGYCREGPGSWALMTSEFPGTEVSGSSSASGYTEIGPDPASHSLWGVYRIWEIDCGAQGYWGVTVQDMGE